MYLRLWKMKPQIRGHYYNEKPTYLRYPTLNSDRNKKIGITIIISVHYTFIYEKIGLSILACWLLSAILSRMQPYKI